METNLPSLDSLGIKHGTDKASKTVFRTPTDLWRRHATYPRHNYLNKYEFFMFPLRQLEFSLCEIGVSAGCSLRMWKEYFPYAKIVGIDIDHQCKRFEEDRIEIHILDGESSETYDYLKGINLNPLVLVEDGSHSFSGQKNALESLFPLVQPGGYYIVEDLTEEMADYLRERTKCLELYEYDNNFSKIITRLKRLSTPEKYIETHTDLICFISAFACLLRKVEPINLNANQPNTVQHNESVAFAFYMLHVYNLPALAVCNEEKFLGILTKMDIDRVGAEGLDLTVGSICNKNCCVLDSFDITSDDGFLYHPVVDQSGRFLGFKYDF